MFAIPVLEMNRGPGELKNVPPNCTASKRQDQIWSPNSALLKEAFNLLRKPFSAGGQQVWDSDYIVTQIGVGATRCQRAHQRASWLPGFVQRLSPNKAVL